MCLQDWRLGRLIVVQQTALAIAAAGSATFAPNKQRVGIMVGWRHDPAGVNITNILVDNVQIGAIGGFVGGFQLFTVEKHGILPTRQWVFSCDAPNTCAGGVVEFFLPENYLAAGLQEFISHYNPGG